MFTSPRAEVLPGAADVSQPQDSVCIIGGGLAGFASAIRIKKTMPECEVLVVEKAAPESNTQIAGQRYRAGVAGKRQDGEQEIAGLFASRNNGEVTPEMVQFAAIGVQALKAWQQEGEFVDHADKREWFGPQWGAPNRAGGGRGKNVLDWFRSAALNSGVSILKGEVQQLNIEEDVLQSIAVRTGKDSYQSLRAGHFVLAGGNAGGQLFQSTNKSIGYSPQELAFAAGLSVVDTTLHMLHPFSKCDLQGNPRTGCFETDELAGVKVYLDGSSMAPIFDAYTTDLLENHQARYHFPELVQRFRKYGSVVMLEFPGGRQEPARVSHHYWHGGVETADGIRVAGVSNLYAAGDASGVGHWTNHKERFPGVALVKCLVDAELVAGALQEVSGRKRQPIIVEPARAPKVASNDFSGDVLKQINTRHLEEWLEARATGDTGRQVEVGEAWVAEAVDFAQNNPATLADMSIALAYAHQEVSAGFPEPIRVNTILADKAKANLAMP